MCFLLKKYFVIIGVLLGIIWASGCQPDTGVHPRLIVHSDSLAVLKTSTAGTHRNLYRNLKKQADSLVQITLPEMTDANNSHRWIGDAMPALSLTYLMTGDTIYKSTSIRWIRALLEVPDWTGSQNLGRSSWIMGMALTYDWLYHELDQKLRAQILERLVLEAHIVMESASYYRALSNHLMIETSAIGIVGLVLDEEQPAEPLLKQAEQWTEYIIDRAPTDGSWGEGVQYWQYGLGYFLRYLEAAVTAGHADYFRSYSWLQKTGYFPMYFGVPDQLDRVINFGDCGTDRYLPPFLFYLPAQKYNDGYVQALGQGLQTFPHQHKFSWLDFLFYDAQLEQTNFRQLPTFRHFEDHGFVSMRSGWDTDATLLGFRCGPAPGHVNQRRSDRVDNHGFGPGHQQPDINNFVIYAHGEWLAIDPGYTKWKETRNHNTILVNGHGQAGANHKWLDFMAFEARSPQPQILLAESNDTYDYVIGDAGHIYVDSAGLNRFVRQIMFLKPDIVVVADKIDTKKESSIDWLLQANQQADLSWHNETASINKKEVSLSIHQVLPRKTKPQIIRRSIAASDASTITDEKNGTLQTMVFQTDGQSAEYLMVLAVNTSEEDRPTVIFENEQLKIRKGNKSYTIAYDTKDWRRKVLNYIPD
ncbi:MAG: heparinase II/III family protein [Reichenbachiella sp.]|uniref:heparinase II/III domain-containing protein n=1 Tax=Reichenbachiella sp. TaxID=2184521 RepID=UPI00329A34DD